MSFKKSQSIIDFAVAFIAIIGLVVGIVRIWIWFNANYSKRSTSYQASRIVAGRTSPYDTKDVPVSIAGTASDSEKAFDPHDLTEDWVFKGESN